MKKDTQWRLRDSEGKEYIIIDSKKVDLQEELNKTIVKQQEEIEKLNYIIDKQDRDITALSNGNRKLKEEKDKEIERLNNELEKQNIDYGIEIERLNNIINECANEILIELKANHHLSYGVALSIRQKLIDYKELKGDSSNE